MSVWALGLREANPGRPMRGDVESIVPFFMVVKAGGGHDLRGPMDCRCSFQIPRDPVKQDPLTRWGNKT